MKRDIVKSMETIKRTLESLRDTVQKLKKQNKRKDRNIFYITDIVSDIKEFGSAWDNLLDNISLLDEKTKKVVEDKFNYVALSFSCFLACDFMRATEFKRKHLNLLDKTVNAFSADVVYKTATKYLKSNKDIDPDEPDYEPNKLPEVWKKTKDDLCFVQNINMGIVQMVHDKWMENYGILCKDHIKSRPLEEHLKDMEE